MIGPHEGQELELMLAGKKRLAAFGDIIPANGEIAEQIIPEQKFKPYVESGEIIRFEEIYTTADGYKKKQVCFTLPNEEWRAKAYMFFRKKISMLEIKYEDTYDEFFGLLLDYDPSDIEHFINQNL